MFVSETAHISSAASELWLKWLETSARAYLQMDSAMSFKWAWDKQNFPRITGMRGRGKNQTMAEDSGNFQGP